MPKVFLSSTIRDLGDLRSAIKYWLEENGFEVLASEWPDFPYPLDRDVVAAALAPIDDCDYYVLLVGARVGELIKDEGISMTRAEFRRARTRRRASGRPQMLHLVRRDIYEARRARRPTEASEEEWAAIVSFLEEISQEGESGDPNWLRKFDSFRDVVDVLRATMRVSGPLVRRALEANLIWELKENTRELLDFTKSGLQPHALWFPSDLTLPSGIDQPLRVEWQTAFGMFRFRLTFPRSGAQITPALEESINSGRFLDYDAPTSSYIVGPLQRCLLELRLQTQSLRGISSTASTDQTIAADTTELADAARQRRPAEITAFTARMLYAAWSATMNVLRLNRAVYRALIGIDGVELPQLSPLYAPDEESKMKAEEVTEQDAELWLRSTAWRVQKGNEASSSS